MNEYNYDTLIPTSLDYECPTQQKRVLNSSQSNSYYVKDYQYPFSFYQSSIVDESPTVSLIYLELNFQDPDYYSSWQADRVDAFLKPMHFELG